MFTKKTMVIAGSVGAIVIGAVGYCFYRKKRVHQRIEDEIEPELEVETPKVKSIDGLAKFYEEESKISDSLQGVGLRSTFAYCMKKIEAFLGNPENCTEEQSEKIAKALTLIFTARNCTRGLSHEFPAEIAPQVFCEGEKLLDQELQGLAGMPTIKSTTRLLIALLQVNKYSELDFRLYREELAILRNKNDEEINQLMLDVRELIVNQKSGDSKLNT